MNQGTNVGGINLGWIGRIIIGVVIVVLLLMLLRFAGQFFYFFEEVSPEEVGVRMKGGQIEDVVGPGLYSDFGLLVDLRRVSSRSVPFTVTDPELITQDKQRLGLVVTGDAFRPGVENKDRLQTLWAQYAMLYSDDELLRARMEDRAKQAMKVCVGDRTFDESVIGTARDELRGCINTELDEMADAYGINIANVAVPEIILLPEAQARLDEIVQSRLQTEKAVQDRLRAQAEAAAEQARQEGEVRVAQSRIQEEARQQATLAELDQARIEAQRTVIEAERANELARVEAEEAIIQAEKNNELLEAQLDLEVQTARAVAAAEQAKAELARQVELAALYAESPAYMQLLLAQANASALNDTDKVIFTPEGTAPTIVIPGPGIVPTVDTSAP
jgi:regulator of protease activity HflC (stomatin/prohibitin superfamily)